MLSGELAMKKYLLFPVRCDIISKRVEKCAYAPVAQLDRVTDYESVGRGFESLPAYQKGQIPSGICPFCYIEREGLE